jgi:hypothetical protein
VDINGEPTTFHFDKDSHGRFYHPKDFPHYDSLPKTQCEAHINYVPRISRKKWEKECPPSTFFFFSFPFPFFSSTFPRPKRGEKLGHMQNPLALDPKRTP